jgi:hypothetical protein
MAYRPTWQGHLKLSLVTCPVALYTAASSSGDIRFNLINPETNNRIKMVTVDPETGLAVERRDLVKGYEFEKGRYVLLRRRSARFGWIAPRPLKSSVSCRRRKSTVSIGSPHTSWPPMASSPRRRSA